MGRDLTLLIAGAVITAVSFGAGYTVGKSAEVRVAVVSQPAPQLADTAAVPQLASTVDPPTAAPPIAVAEMATPEPAEAPAVIEVQTVSFNTSSKKYHRPGCKWYNCRNCEPTSLESALAAGGVPCKVCH